MTHLPAPRLPDPDLGGLPPVDLGAPDYADRLWRRILRRRVDRAHMAGDDSLPLSIVLGVDAHAALLITSGPIEFGAGRLSLDLWRTVPVFRSLSDPPASVTIKWPHVPQSWEFGPSGALQLVTVSEVL